MDRVITYNKCQAGHKFHSSLKVQTKLGEMFVWDWEKYKDQKGIYCPGQDDLSRTLINEGIWEKDNWDLVNSILDNGDPKLNIVIDVGCHIGWYSRMAEKKGYKVYAYDGCQDNLDLLIHNTILTNTYLLDFTKDLRETVDYIKSVELLKIDIEGAERYAIRYFDKLLPVVNNILMEVSPVFNDSYPDLINELVNRGFEVREVNRSEFDFNYNFPQKDLWLRRIK